MRRSLSKPTAVAVAVLTVACAIAPSCSSDDSTQTTTTLSCDTLTNGDICPTVTADEIKVRVEPSRVFVTPCTDASGASCVHRAVNVIVDPDVTTRIPIGFTVATTPAGGSAAAFDITDPTLVDATDENGNVVSGPSIGVHQPVVPLSIRGGASPGTTTITVNVPRGDGTTATTSLDVEVLADTAPRCEGAAAVSGTVKPGGAVKGDKALAGASIALPAGADKPNSGSFLWSVAAFDAQLSCATGIVPKGYIALGPAIAFGPADSRFPREVPLSIPLNPALMPSGARLRHLRVAYSGPAFKAPRTVPVADMHIEQVGGAWALTFKAPRLGTYQAVVKATAGTISHPRRLTHRAVLGISMGAGGAAMMGLRHHDLFDVIAPLGGVTDVTWLLHYIETNHLAGFRPIAPGTKLSQIQLTKTPCMSNAECQPDETCVGVLTSPVTPGKCTIMGVVTDPYAHAQSFDTWWYEYPNKGGGGTFSRDTYAQLFRDLALAFGNPNGDNFARGGETLPAGVPPLDKSQVGDHPDGECSVWVNPLDCADGSATCPEKTQQEEIANDCPKERCAHPLTLLNYYDDEYNPDGTFPVITVCDGSSINAALTPYANTWHEDGNESPLEVALAVDYNGNGVRDELEPVIRSGHEPWSDVGLDGVASAQEAGYQPGVNEDPAGDDYDAQYNPNGTEGDYRYEVGEPFEDVGLDGVMGTKQQPPEGWRVPGDGYDVGEGDGEFTASRGLRRMWDFDPHSILLRPALTSSIPGGDLDDEALSRIDVWADGGLRDLFNFHVQAQHLVGGFAARDRDVTYLTYFNQAPGYDPTQPDPQEPARIVFEDLPGVVLQRYGKIDPTDEDIQDGSGEHVGTAEEAASRFENAFYYIGSRWPEPELRTLVADSSTKPAPGATDCEVLGNCTFDFTSSEGRKGPVAVTLPPGYAHADQQSRRYPVIFVLHGYGQKPQDLQALLTFVYDWMNGTTKSMASRIPKAIVVFVDGKCRIGPSGKPECIEGNFFTDSVRAEGAHLERWWLELMSYIDQHYRTLPPSVVDWTE